MNAPAPTTRVAFLGLGLMGSGMASRLLGAGFPLVVYNRSRAKAEPLAAAGAKLAATPAEAAQSADVILSMVADDQAARAVWLGADGALATARAGTICIESSTVTAAWVRELAAAAQARGCAFIDAPVTGSKGHARAGELNFLVGGDAATLERARPVLAAMSRTITHLGPVGSGATIKLINNFVCGTQVAALAEALAFIERSGLDRERALDVMLSGAPGSPLVKTISARMTAADYTPNFFLRLLAKDLGYAIAEARRQSLELATATTALAAFERAIAAGHGDRDMSAVIEPLRRKN
ncbi:MAG TPA: NAD(P)-dependent oxidoreductase [Opitutaceae bacterium]|nr:NAD(P)-dependent oxidoreductase [Opitutaceae bacterium]